MRRSSVLGVSSRPPPASVHAAALAELHGPGGLMDLADLEGHGGDAYERAALPIALPDPRLLISALGFQLRHSPVRGCAGAAHCFGVVYFRPRPGEPRRQGLALFHELAHALLERAGAPHDHRDVWRLTLVLLCPWSELRALARCGGLSGRALGRHQRHAPVWALALRLQMALETLQIA